MRFYIVSLYRAGARRPGDCLPEYFTTRSEARGAAEYELARVAAIPMDKREPTIDWAARYTIRKI